MKILKKFSLPILFMIIGFLYTAFVKFTLLPLLGVQDEIYSYETKATVISSKPSDKWKNQYCNVYSYEFNGITYQVELEEDYLYEVSDTRIAMVNPNDPEDVNIMTGHLQSWILFLPGIYFILHGTIFIAIKFKEVKEEGFYV